MNTKTILNIKIDKTLKKEAQKTAQEVGLPLGTVLNVFLRQFVRDKEITASSPHKPSTRLIKILREAEEELAAQTICGPFESIPELAKELDR